MLSERLFERSRPVAAVAGAVAVFLGAVGFQLGFGYRHGGYVAWAALLAGLAAACAAWWLAARDLRGDGLAGMNVLLAASFAGMAGLALYLNLSWLLWARGVPLDIGAVRDGRMAEHRWLGPAVLVWAGLCWIAFRASVPGKADRDAPSRH